MIQLWVHEGTCHVFREVCTPFLLYPQSPLKWRHNERDGVSNHQRHDCLLNCLFGRRSKKTSKLRVTGLCVGNSPVTGEFPTQRASNADFFSIWWHHHVCFRKHAIVGVAAHLRVCHMAPPYRILSRGRLLYMVSRNIKELPWGPKRECSCPSRRYEQQRAPWDPDTIPLHIMMSQG